MASPLMQSVSTSFNGALNQGWITDIGTILTKYRDDFQEIMSDHFKPEGYLLLKKFIEIYTYWAGKGKLISLHGHGDGWFYITVAKLEKKTKLSKYKQGKYSNAFKEAYLLEKEKAGRDGKNHFRLNMPNIISLFNLTLFSGLSKEKIIKSSACVDYVGLDLTQKIIQLFPGKKCENKELQIPLKNPVFLPPGNSSFLPPVVKNAAVRCDSCHNIYNKKTIEEKRREEETDPDSFSSSTTSISLQINTNNLPKMQMNFPAGSDGIKKPLNLFISTEYEMSLIETFDYENEFNLSVVQEAYRLLSEYKTKYPGRANPSDQESLKDCHSWPIKNARKNIAEEIQIRQIESRNKQYSAFHKANAELNKMSPENQIDPDLIQSRKQFISKEILPKLRTESKDKDITLYDHANYLCVGQCKLEYKDANWGGRLKEIIKESGFSRNVFELCFTNYSNSNRTMDKIS